MINKQPAILDGTSELGGIQSSNHRENLNAYGVTGLETQMMGLQMELGQTKKEYEKGLKSGIQGDGMNMSID